MQNLFCIVHSNKPAHRGDTVFTDKTGGYNQDDCAVERTFADKLETERWIGT